MTRFCTLTAAFTTGLCVGLLVAPRSGEHTRRRIAVRARWQMRRAEHKLEEVERQLTELNERLNATRQEWGTRLREAAEETIGDHIPDLSDDWDLKEEEVSRELRNMSRK